MSSRVRITLFLTGACTVGVVIAWVLTFAPSFGDYRGPYGDLVNSSIIGKRNLAQGVAAVNFDIRGFDTLGEEFILFTAVAGTLLLMRPQAQEHQNRPKDRSTDRKVPPVNDALHAAGTIMFPVTLLFGIAMVLHGHLTPGGGFQGGVIMSSAFYFIYLSGEYEDLAAFMPDHAVEMLEAAGAGAFALIATLPLVRGLPFMFNLLPLGTTGDLLSAGTVPVFNTAVGIEVAAAFLLVISSFLKQTLILRRSGRKK